PTRRSLTLPHQLRTPEAGCAALTHGLPTALSPHLIREANALRARYNRGDTHEPHGRLRQREQRLHLREQRVRRAGGGRRGRRWRGNVLVLRPRCLTGRTPRDSVWALGLVVQPG